MILTFNSQMAECQQHKHTQYAPSTKSERDYLNGWIKNGRICKNLTKIMGNARDLAEMIYHISTYKKIIFLFILSAKKVC